MLRRGPAVEPPVPEVRGLVLCPKGPPAPPGPVTHRRLTPGSALCRITPSLLQPCRHSLPAPLDGAPHPACPWPAAPPGATDYVGTEDTPCTARHTAHRLDRVCPSPTEGEALAMPPSHRSPWLPTSACLSPLCPQGWGPAESHRPLLFPHLTPSAPPWKPTGGSWRHRAPGAPTAPCHRARLAEDTPTQAPRDPSCPLPQLPISHQCAPLHPRWLSLEDTLPTARALRGGPSSPPFWPPVPRPRAGEEPPSPG